MTKRRFELKPCPFCGGYAKSRIYYAQMSQGARSPVAEVSCQGCGAKVTEWKYDYDSEVELAVSAAKKWNRRTVTA